MQVQKDDVKNKILKSSEELFLMNGYNQTSLNDVAKKCGISKSNIYNYFKSKNSIFNCLTSDAKAKFEFISDLLSRSSFEGSENLQEGLTSLIFNHILPVKEGVILIYDREKEETESQYISNLLDVINNMVVPDLTNAENTTILRIIAENLIKGYVDILKSGNGESIMKYQITALTKYHAGGLAFLKQAVLEKNEK